jgi:hypothetical protein
MCSQNHTYSYYINQLWTTMCLWLKLKPPRWLILQGILPIVPVNKIQADLTAQKLWVVRITQITKTDKAIQTLITIYPAFVVTFKHGTEIHEVLQIRNIGQCIIRWDKYISTKPVHQCFHCQSFGHSINFWDKPTSKCVKCDQSHAMRES